MRVYRIGDPDGRYPIFSSAGAAKVEGRWHARGQDVIYASSSYSTALLEKLAHWNGNLPPNQHYVEIVIPAGVSYEVVTKDTCPEWIDVNKARAVGAKWFAERRSAILVVPSFVARIETNVILNVAHEEFNLIKCGLETPVMWDKRLFGKPLT